MPEDRYKMTKPGRAICIVCQGAVLGSDGGGQCPWAAPGGALLFQDTGTYGSRLNDAAVDGHYFNILICDECVEANRDLVREMDYIKACQAH